MEPTKYRTSYNNPVYQLLKDGDIYDIGQTVNGVSQFLYINNTWYYASSLVFKYNYSESELTDLITSDEGELISSVHGFNRFNKFNKTSIKLIGNIFSDNELRSGLDFSQSNEIIEIMRDKKLNDLLN